MDPVNRRYALQFLLEFAARHPERQLLLLTPQDIAGGLWGRTWGGKQHGAWRRASVPGGARRGLGRAGRAEEGAPVHVWTAGALAAGCAARPALSAQRLACQARFWE